MVDIACDRSGKTHRLVNAIWVRSKVSLRNISARWSVPDRQYTDEFREAAVKLVVDGGRAIRQVARSLKMSAGTLGNWVVKANKGQALSKWLSGAPMNELEAEVSRLRQEVSRLKVEKETLKTALAACRAPCA